MPIRVALDFQATRHERTGIGSYTAALADALRRQEGIEVLPVDWGWDPVMRLHRRLHWQQIQLPLRARRAGADLLHVTGFDAPYWRPLPTVLTVHDLIGMLFPRNLPPIARFYWSRWLPSSVRRADHIIADSEHTRQDLVCLLHVREERITVIPLGVDRRFAPRPPETVASLRGRLGLPGRFLLYVGTLEPRKGIDTLLSAWARIASRLPDVDLVIAGKPGWHTDRLHLQARDLGVEPRVRWTGYVDHGDLPALYSAAEALVFPSRYEGFGLPPLEAMACGTPVITSNSSSLPEVVGDAGLLLPPDDVSALAHAIYLVMTQPALRAELRERGLRRARDFTWERTAARTRAVYESVLRSV